MKNLSLGLKISLGFAILIIIAASLGFMAIWNMNQVGKQSTMLAQEYIPEVAVAMELRGAANRVMYEMRGYGFTEDIRFYEAAQREFKTLETALQKARQLDADSPNLTQLKGQIEIATKAVENYKILVQQTVDTNAKLTESRAILSSSAQMYMTNSNAFLAGQVESFKKDLNSRQQQMKIVSHLVDIGASTRVLNFKSQALGNPKLMSDAVSTIEKAYGLLTELRKLTSAKDYIDRIDKTEFAAKNYQEAMNQFHGEFIKGNEASKIMLDKWRKEMDQNAAIYVQNCDEFLSGQQEQLTKDMLERQDKITKVNDIIDLGNEVRVGTNKSQAMRSPKIMEEALSNFPKIQKLLDELKKTTRSNEYLQMIETVRTAGDSYKNAMTEFLKNWLILQDLGEKRGSIGQEVITACNTTADAGMSTTDTIAKNSQASLSKASMTMIIGLIIALVTGIAVAFFIIRSITGPVNRIIEGLNEGSAQVASASTQVSSSSQSMAEGASQQAASIEETSSSMEEMSSMTKKNAENASQADALMKETNHVVATANSSMDQLTCSMKEITKASEETSKIIKTIDEIAFQTNLLALNAAVEAARAGEAGAGFAVVAEEVRNLAMRSADAAKNTASLIESTVKKVNDGSKLVAMTNEAFSKVAESSSTVGNIVSEIAEASKEQSNGIEQVNIAISEMDKVVQQNASNAEESASASEEMSAQAEQLKDYVRDLVILVKGNKNNANANIVHNHHKIRQVSSQSQKKLPGRDKRLSHNVKEVRPNQVIPFDDDEFENF